MRYMPGILRFIALLSGELLKNFQGDIVAMKKEKLLQKVLSSTKNVRFKEMVTLVEAFGFRLSRISGSHHVFIHPDIPEQINLQSVKGQAKPYQVRQFLKLVEKYNLTLKKDA